MTVVHEPSTRGVLTRFRKRPRAGGGHAFPPDRAGDFSPRLPRRSPSPSGFRPDVSGSPSGSVAKAAQRPRPALPARSPPPLDRSPAERPPPRRGKEKYGGGFQGDASILDGLVGGGGKVLIYLGSGAPIPAYPRGLALAVNQQQTLRSSAFDPGRTFKSSAPPLGELSAKPTEGAVPHRPARPPPTRRATTPRGGRRSPPTTHCGRRAAAINCLDGNRPLRSPPENRNRDAPLSERIRTA